MTAMPAVPTTAKGIQTRGKVLDAARSVFARDGYVDSRMSDIAAEAGLSNGGLYRYFDSKSEVFAALIADLHEELFVASGRTDASLADDPRAALAQANRGYIEHYHANSDVMRAFIEAAAVDERFRTIWWEMRTRHAQRFAAAVRVAHGIADVSGVDIEVATDALACMVEQCCYVWFAHESLNPSRVSVDTAVEICTHSWYRTFFDER